MERGFMIVAGFGFRKGASTDSLRAALTGCRVAPDLLATAADKAGCAGLQALAADLGVAVHAVPAEILQTQRTQTHSPASQAAHGIGSVAEAAALAAAGPGARLIAARQISPDRMATCAMAEGDGP